MMRGREAAVARRLFVVVLVVALGVPAWGLGGKLAISPAKLPAEKEKYSLLPPENTLTDGDAVPLYEQAIKALPSPSRDGQVRELLDLPIEQLPLQQAEQMVQQHIESLRLAAKAARCKQCNWPDWTPGASDPVLQGYRQIAFVVALWARLEIAQGHYDGALLALQTGFGMARHLGRAPTIIQVLVGAAIAPVMGKEVAQFAQSKGAPNLYWALAQLPRPFVDVENAIETERKAAFGDMNEALRQQAESQLQAAYDRARLLAKRVDSELGALQCVEAIRSYAASHGGQLPPTLDAITEVSLPVDSISGEPFEYRKTGATAVLRSALPEGDKEKARVAYEITVKN